MSADNWALCPRCKRDAATEKAKLEEQVSLKYGQIPISDWDELRARASEPLDLKCTLREDYEVGITEDDGEFYLYYKAGCTACGLAFDRELHEQVES